MPTSIPIAQQNSSGIFTSIAAFSFRESNTKLRVVDINAQTTDFTISDSGLLCFAISVADGEGGEKDYFMTDIEELTEETASSELKENLPLAVKLDKDLNPEALFLDFIGEGDQDALRTRMKLSHGVEFGLERTENSVILKVYVPEEE